MPRTVTLEGVKLDRVRLEWDTETGDVQMMVRYSLTDAEGRVYQRGRYAHTLSTQQKTSLRNILQNQVIPAIKVLEQIDEEGA